MRRSLGCALALVLAPSIMVPLAPVLANDRALPMRFDWRRQGPADDCGARCKTWISARGAITADSARVFEKFLQSRDARGRDLRAVTVVLDSDGGSVLGAIALGRAIRKAALSTTVGRTIDLDDTNGTGSGGQDGGAKAADTKRAVMSPRGDCESMCAFVLLGGVRRMVPPQARVMVHQIWLGDRRDDPTAATYSAQDLVLVQRDIGRLAQYTAEMGASIDLLDLALRIPPWEPLHIMTRDEIRSTRLATGEAIAPQPATVAVSPPATVVRPAQPVTEGARATPINELRWAMVERAGATTLARRHPLTVEGEDIGRFDLALTCCGDPDSFDLSYIEHRRFKSRLGGAERPLPAKLSDVRLRAGRSEATLKVISSQRRDEGHELVSYASGSVPVEMIGAFADAGHHSMVIQTISQDTTTVIRLGNTGAQGNLPRLTAGCAKLLGDRAEAAVPTSDSKTGGMAQAR